jgi:acetyl esterase
VHVFATYREAASDQARSGATPADPLTMPIEEARAQQDRYFQSLGAERPAVAATRDFAVSGPHGAIPIRLVFPRTDVRLPCIVFLRGAGFWAGGLDSHARTVHTLANLSGCAVCAVDYRRTPEHAYPVQRDEVLAVLGWLAEAPAQAGLIDRQPVLFGESAGATLALSAALTLRDAAAAMPSGLVLFYNNAGGPKPGARAYSQWVWKQYLGDADPQTVPGAVPMMQSMHDLPPTWLACGEDDPLMEDTLALARRLADAKVPFALHAYRALPHAFLMFAATLRPAHDALVQGAAAARDFLDLELSDG